MRQVLIAIVVLMLSFAFLGLDMAVDKAFDAMDLGVHSNG